MNLNCVLGRPQEWARTLTFATAAGVFAGIIGPFGSYLNGRAPDRVMYWTAMFWAGAAVLNLSVRSAAGLGLRLGLPLWFTVFAVVLLCSAPLAAMAAGISSHLWPELVRGMGVADWYLQTFAFAAPMTAALVASARLGRGRANHIDQEDYSGATPSVVNLVTRLPRHLGKDILCLQMEDHYVRAHTPLGSDLILISLRQAVAELGALEGLQVHRSWWVARAALSSTIADGRNLRLKLRNGLEVPVARNRIAEFRAAGWLDDASSRPEGETRTT